MVGTFILIAVYDRIRPFVVEGLTLHQTLGEVFQSPSIQRWASLWTIISFVGTVGLELYGGVILLRWMGLNSLHSFVGALLLAFVVSAFTVSGGLRGIAIADLLLDASTFVALGILIWFVERKQLSFSGVLTVQLPYKQDPLFIVGMAVIFVPFQLCTLDTWQRFASWGGRSKRRPTAWLVISSVLLSLAFCFPIICGVIGRMTGLSSPPGAHILLAFITWLHVPSVLIGLVVAGLISAILSTADELLNCCSMTLLFDVFGLRRPQQADASAEPRLVASGKFYTAAFSFISCGVVAIALVYGKEISDLAMAIFSTQVVFTVPLVVALFFPKRAPALAGPSIVSMVTGFAVAVALVVVGWITHSQDLADGAPVAAFALAIVVFAVGAFYNLFFRPRRLR
jgi:Na+/proline symporter